MSFNHADKRSSYIAATRHDYICAIAKCQQNEDALNFQRRVRPGHHAAALQLVSTFVGSIDLNTLQLQRRAYYEALYLMPAEGSSYD